MIERWLSITCDVCGDVANAPMPNMSVKEFLESLGRTFRRTGRGRNVRDICGPCHQHECSEK